MGEPIKNVKPAHHNVGTPGPDPHSVLRDMDAKGDLTGLSTRSRLYVKRTFDVVVSLCLLVLFAPACLLIGLLIRFDSPGPVFFFQTRIGRNRRRAKAQQSANGVGRTKNLYGAPFRVLKFRTMHTHAQAYANSPVASTDARITRVGRVLRKTCLDELPQLLNVLSGEMSLVGPRPEMPFIVERYDDVQRRRLDAKPGITGLWQLRGMRDRHIHESVGWDLYYVQNWSLHLDLSILAETVVFALRARNR